MKKTTTSAALTLRISAIIFAMPCAIFSAISRWSSSSSTAPSLFLRLAPLRVSTSAPHDEPPHCRRPPRTSPG
eukprot:5030116-Alexandrium_andersonii.AAC.1